MSEKSASSDQTSTITEEAVTDQEMAADEPTGVDESEPDEPLVSPPGKRWSPLRRTGTGSLRGHTSTVAILVLLVLLAGGGVWAVILSSKHADARRVADARTQASAAARTLALGVLSYDYRKIDQDLSAAESSTTGSFRTQYRNLFTERIKPVATRQGVVTSADVVAVSVVRATANQVVTLVYLNQTTTSKQQRTPRLDSSRARVTLTNVGSRWLISALEPV